MNLQAAEGGAFQPALAIPFEVLSHAGYAAVDGFPDDYSDSWFAQCGIDLPPLVAGSVRRRRREFFFGRLCARAAIRRIVPGESGAVALRADRRPGFPEGLSGSITHTEDFAAAVCICATEGSIGIDAEPIFSIGRSHALAAYIACGDELCVARDMGCDSSIALTAIYSAKESLFKAIYPHMERICEFHASRLVAWDASRSQFTLQLTECLGAGWPAGRCIDGWLVIDSDKVLTAVLLPPVSTLLHEVTST
jgi:enterobactin synthetase component D